jgi:hypothetical protein
MYKTQFLVLFCRSDSMHTYSAGSISSEGATNWLEHSRIGQSTPADAALQMEGFTISGCGNGVKKSQDGASFSHSSINTNILW